MLGDELEYSASLLDMPDLPSWMFCNHPPNKSEAYLYGSAEEPGNIKIEVRFFQNRKKLYTKKKKKKNTSFK